MVPGIADDYWRLIRRYQPYRRDDAGRALRLLRNISDIDKHRYIKPTFVCARELAGEISLQGCTVSDIDWFSTPKRALRVGTKVVWMRVTPYAPDHDVDIKSKLTIYPTLGYGVPLFPAVVGIGETVRKILGDFDALI